MSHANFLNSADLLPPSAWLPPQSRRGDGWDTVADLEVFVFAVEAELEAMDRERVGMQWRVAGWLSGVSFTTLHGSFARWMRLGLWRRLGQRLALDWRPAHGDEVLPSAVVVDSRSLRSAPSAWARGIDGGKPGKSGALPMVKDLKLLVACDKHGSLLDLELHTANTDNRACALPMLPRLAALGLQGDLLGDDGFRGAPFAAAALEYDILGGSRSEIAWLGPARRHPGRALPATRDQVGSRAAARLVEPLSAAQRRL